ncbi:MAG: ABC transporter ATP-binding protein [Methylothermaceae bacteria B42]|nr:MAG: ABC transporter ATP-binding protein [Methylothermaceae bacteria B42]HHJ39086.1 ABC transporter ATP-binding protein [Methylothermaceae bacterium]
MSIVSLVEVSKSYLEGDDRHWIFKSISMAIEAGEFIVLLGRSGSGKSTLLNLIAGIDAPDSGKITVSGNELNQLSETSRTLFRRRHIGFVFQSFNLIPTLTVKENILFPLELNNLLDNISQEETAELLNRLRLQGRENTFPDRLSGGEQQRVAIARALIHQPDIVLADEPTGNLDLETGREVLNLLDELVRERGKTLIMATHSQEVIGMADRILTLRHGQLESAGQ